MVYLGSPGGRTSGEGITCQPTQPVSYSSIKFDQAATCFQHLQLGLQLSTKWFKISVRYSVKYN